MSRLNRSCKLAPPLAWIVAGGLAAAGGAAVYTGVPSSDRSIVGKEGLRALSQSAGGTSHTSRPVEGYDASTPFDEQCLRHGYQYRVHMPALLPGPLCAVFYRDDLDPAERELAHLGIHMAVRYVVTPISQADHHPVPEDVKGKPRVSPQEFVQWDELVGARLAEWHRRDAPVPAFTNHSGDSI